MSWLTTLGRKSFTQRPFWDMDSLRYPLFSTSLMSGEEKIGADFESYISAAYKDSGVVFACVLARMLLFSEARFMWRRERNGRPQDLFSSSALDLLHRPWPGGTTGDLLSRMEVDASAAGNSFLTTADDAGRVGKASVGGPNRRVIRMRPDWVTIMYGVPERDDGANLLNARLLMYVYRPPGGRDEDEVRLLPGEVCHYAPIPDPVAHWRGMSWITPIIREIEADKAATIHKGKFFKNGATPNLSVTLDKDIKPDQFQLWMEKFKEAHQGADNAYKTLYLGGGADVKALSADFKQLDFKLTQGAGETRIAAAAGVPPVIVGLSEGLQSATYSNYGQARRRFADGTMRPLWRNAAASLANLLESPGSDASLWYDTADISFLREDQSDLAQIQNLQAQTIRQLVDAGYDPTTVVAAVKAEDFSLLAHSGLYSVQLQEPGASGETAQVVDQSS